MAIDGYMKRVVINDYDRSIYAFWHSILYYTDAFIDKIRNTPLSIDEWYTQRQIQQNKQNVDLFDLGFSTFFLNRTNRSGVLKAGVIGGLQQIGTYKIDARYNKEQLIERIQLIAQFKDKFILHNEDAINLLRRYRNIARKNLIYLDPPYYIKGRELYVNFFKEADHIALSQAIQQRDNMNWIITYDNPYTFIPTADTEITAVFTEESQEVTYYTVTINKNTIRVAEGTTLPQPADPVKEGYKFIGWYVGDKEYDFSAPVMSDLVIEARFEKIDTPVDPGKPGTDTPDSTNGKTDKEDGKAVQTGDQSSPVVWVVVLVAACAAAGAVVVIRKKNKKK